MPPSQLPSLDELVTNPVVAAAVVVMIVNAIVYFTRFQPTWLALVVSEAYMLLGYIATGRTQPDQLFLAAVTVFFWWLRWLTSTRPCWPGCLVARRMRGTSPASGRGSSRSGFNPTVEPIMVSW